MKNKNAASAHTPVSLITGASSGLGREFAHLAAQSGFNVVALGRNSRALIQLKQDLENSYGITVYMLSLDLCKQESIKKVLAFLERHRLSVDLLINNAGFGYASPYASSKKARQNNLEKLDVTVVRKLCHALLPAMLKRKSGAILNVASVAAFLPGPYMATYFASKAYVYSLSCALHDELRHVGIKVSALCPGPVNTRFWESADAGRTIYTKIMKSPASVARAGFKGLMRNKAVILPGLLAKTIFFASRILPRSWVSRLAGLMNQNTL